jgi:hypothetical protein
MPGDFIDFVTDGSAVFKVRKMVVADEQPTIDNSNLFLCADKTWKVVPGTTDTSTIVDSTNALVNVNGVTVSERDVTYASSTAAVDIDGTCGVYNVNYTDTTGNNILVLTVKDSAWNFDTGRSKIIRVRVTVASVAPAMRVELETSTATIIGLDKVSLKASLFNYVYLELKNVSSSERIIYCYPGTSNIS